MIGSELPGKPRPGTDIAIEFFSVRSKQVDIEWTDGFLADCSHRFTQPCGRRTGSTQTAEAAGVAHDSNDMRIGRARHRRLDDGMFDSEQIEYFSVIPHYAFPSAARRKK